MANAPRKEETTNALVEMGRYRVKSANTRESIELSAELRQQFTGDPQFCKAIRDDVRRKRHQ